MKRTTRPPSTGASPWIFKATIAASILLLVVLAKRDYSPPLSPSPPSASSSIPQEPSSLPLPPSPSPASTAPGTATTEANGEARPVPPAEPMNAPPAVERSVRLSQAPIAAEAVRVVGGAGIAPPPIAQRPPERIEPPAKPMPPAEPVEPRLLGAVVVRDAATLQAGRLRVHLPGIEPLDVTETCRDGLGIEWPCGRVALTSIRAFVRGRAIECDLPRKATIGEFQSTCRVGGTDLAGWAIEHGWARAGYGDGPLVEAQRTAEKEQRGIHRNEAPSFRLPAAIDPALTPDPIMTIPDASPPREADPKPPEATAGASGAGAASGANGAPMRVLPPDLPGGPMP